MKRYRVLSFDFNSTSLLLKEYRAAKSLSEQDKSNLEKIMTGLKGQFGEFNLESKVENLIEIGPKYFSVIAYHNSFLEQVRQAFVIGAYYPALTSACALGERILNQILLGVKDSFKTTPEYKKVGLKEKNDDWERLIEALSNWKILLPNASLNFEKLRKKRHYSLHFNASTDARTREEALESILLIQEIVAEQFSAFGSQPWFITGIPGEIYIKKSWEDNPFIKLVYLPNSILVGYKHEIKSVLPWLVSDNQAYEDSELTDEKFVELRNQFAP